MNEKKKLKLLELQSAIGWHDQIEKSNCDVAIILDKNIHRLLSEGITVWVKENIECCGTIYQNQNFLIATSFPIHSFMTFGSKKLKSVEEFKSLFKELFESLELVDIEESK